TRWQTIVDLICAAKQSLKIFTSHGDVLQQSDAVVRYYLEDRPDFTVNQSPGSQDEVLIFGPEKSESSISSLPRQFPNLTRLLIYSCAQLYESDTFMDLVQQWTNLKHLTLFGISDPEKLSPQFW